MTEQEAAEPTIPGRNIRAMLVERGAFAAPAVLFDGEAYVGRQHLPYLRYRLAQK